MDSLFDPFCGVEPVRLIVSMVSSILLPYNRRRRLIQVGFVPSSSSLSQSLLLFILSKAREQFRKLATRPVLFFRDISTANVRIN